MGIALTLLGCWFINSSETNARGSLLGLRGWPLLRTIIPFLCRSCAVLLTDGQMRLIGSRRLPIHSGEDIELPYHSGGPATAQSKSEQTSSGAGEMLQAGNVQ